MFKNIVILLVASLDMFRFNSLERELKQLLHVKLKIIAEEFEFLDHEKFELIGSLVSRKCTDKFRFTILIL